VPWNTASRILEKLASDDVILHLDKAATHRFSEPSQLGMLGQTATDLLAQIQNNKT
jgi:hypothetical protein